MNTELQRLSTLARQLQAYFNWVEGDPNGIVDAPMGAIRTDTTTGDVYRKTTVLGDTTGWVTP